MECDWENCESRKRICKETQKAIDEDKEPKGCCCQCIYCEGKCNPEYYNSFFKRIIRKLRDRRC